MNPQIAWRIVRMTIALGLLGWSGTSMAQPATSASAKEPAPGVYETADPTVYETVDATVPFENQLKADYAGPVTMVGTYVFDSQHDMDAFIETWSKHSAFMRTQPGYVSSNVYRGIGGAKVMMFVANWASLPAFQAAGRAEAEGRAAAIARVAASGSSSKSPGDMARPPRGRRILMQAQ